MNHKIDERRVTIGPSHGETAGVIQTTPSMFPDPNVGGPLETPHCSIIHFPNTGQFPFYDVYQKDNLCIVKIALAGWNKHDLDVRIANNLLTVAGRIGNAQGSSDDPVRVHKGMTSMAFEREFPILQNTRIEECYFQDGMLTIRLQTYEAPTQLVVIEDSPAKSGSVRGPQ